MQDKILQLFEFEKKYNLLEFQIDNIYIWQYLRGEIVYQVLNQSSKQNTFFNIDNQTRISSLRKILKILTILKNSIFYNPFFTFKKYQKIVFQHARKSLINHQYIDVYSNDFIDNKTLVVDASFDEKFYTDYKRNSFLNLSMYILRFFIQHNIHKNKNEVDKIETLLINELNCKVDLYTMFNKHIVTFKAFYIVYSLLFRYIKPKEIFIVVNYGQAPLIKASKDNGVKVIELQHGNIDKYHYGYAYPYNNHIEYFPDYLYVFGEYFKTLNYLPLTKEHIKIHSYSFFRDKIEQFKNIPKEKNAICIISDATFLGGELQNFILDNIEFLSKCKIYYKLHPQEIANDVYKYNKITKQILELDFIEIVSSKYDLYELLCKSHYVISPISTVIFEALEASCKVIVPHIGQWELDEELQKYIFLANTNMRLNSDVLTNYFNTIEFPEKGYFLNSLKDI